MKATGIVRRIDDLGRVVIPKEIRRTLRIREGDPSLITLKQWQRFAFAMLDLHNIGAIFAPSLFLFYHIWILYIIRINFFFCPLP